MNPLIQALVDRRKALGLTQGAVAEIIRRSPAHVCRWERGKEEPTLRNIDNWCGALGVKLTLTEDNNSTKGA